MMQSLLEQHCWMNDRSDSMEFATEEFKRIFQAENVLEQEPMNIHTSFRTGGPARFFLKAGNPEQILEAIKFCKENDIPYTIMGNGTNLLVKDSGFYGAVIQLGENINTVTCEGENIIIGAGALLSAVAKLALYSGLSGFEFASGIPGAFGGAVCMNAGAYGGELKQVLVSADCIFPDGTVRTLSVDELELGYRTSRVMKEGLIVTSGIIHLTPGDREEIRSRMSELLELRREKQPLEYPSAGSTFKRPVGHFAGKLISDAGLKGFSIGGAQVSEKHAGFIINRENATSEDILNLIAYCQKRVFELTGVQLEPEVKIIGN